MTVDEALKVVDRRRSSWMSVDAVTGVLADEVRRLRQRVKELEEQNRKLVSEIDYFSYVTRMGVNEWSPEDLGRMNEWHASLGIKP